MAGLHREGRCEPRLSKMALVRESAVSPQEVRRIPDTRRSHASTNNPKPA